MSSDEVEMPPVETQHEWLRFMAGKPDIRVISEWIWVKSTEIGWNDLDLMLALVTGVESPVTEWYRDMVKAKLRAPGPKDQVQ